MKPYISCNIEVLSVSDETVWILSLPVEAASDAALLLSGLLYGKIKRVKFADKSCAAILAAADDSTLNLDGVQIKVTKIWLEAVLGLLLEVCLNGWAGTAHLDQDFEKISVTVAVLPPEK